MRLTEHVHQVLSELLRPGDTCLDATSGNGHDTLALARLVGTEGKVIAIDKQPAAIEATRARLAAAGAEAPCTLLCADHADAANRLLATHRGKLRAAVFNLGYLPGGNKTVISGAPTTVAALDASADLLAAGGRMLVTAYSGHPGGPEEARAVAAWMDALDQRVWHVSRHAPTALRPDRSPPVLWIASRLVEP